MLLQERQRVAPSREQILSSLPEPFRSALLSMYEGIYNWVGWREAFPRRDYRHFPGRENVDL